MNKYKGCQFGYVWFYRYWSIDPLGDLLMKLKNKNPYYVWDKFYRVKLGIPNLIYKREQKRHGE